jgi:hypothetical protein
MPTENKLNRVIFHDELISSTKPHPLLLKPPYQLTLSISELTTPKDQKENKNRASNDSANKKNQKDENQNQVDNIPRPHNAFILFRSDYAAKMKNLYNDQKISIRVISQMASKQWRKEPEVVKIFFKVLADMYQERHRALYPHYKYSPKTKSSPPYNVKKTKLSSKAISKRDELKRKKKECMITWYVHDNIEDEDKRSDDAYNWNIPNDSSQQDSQMPITQSDSQQIPATFINYTASPSSSSLTFHSTTTTSTSYYDRFTVDSNNNSSLLNSSSSSPPQSPPLDYSFWTGIPDNCDNVLSLFDFNNEGTFFLN